MKPIQHRSNNDVLAAPPGVPADEVRALAITRIQYANGVQGIASFWRPSEEQLKLLDGGFSVRVTVLGRMHPPIAIGVDGDGELDL